MSRGSPEEGGLVYDFADLAAFAATIFTGAFAGFLIGASRREWRTVDPDPLEEN